MENSLLLLPDMVQDQRHWMCRTFSGDDCFIVLAKEVKLAHNPKKLIPLHKRLVTIRVYFKGPDNTGYSVGYDHNCETQEDGEQYFDNYDPNTDAITTRYRLQHKTRVLEQLSLPNHLEPLQKEYEKYLKGTWIDKPIPNYPPGGPELQPLSDSERRKLTMCDWPVVGDVNGPESNNLKAAEMTAEQRDEIRKAVLDDMRRQQLKENPDQNDQVC